MLAARCLLSWKHEAGLRPGRSSSPGDQACVEPNDVGSEICDIIKVHTVNNLLSGCLLLFVLRLFSVKSVSEEVHAGYETYIIKCFNPLSTKSCFVLFVFFN